MTTTSTTAGHELFLRLAGRFPDGLLWRLRDWSAMPGAGSSDAVGAVLPRALLRHRIGLTPDERALLATVVGQDSPSRRLVDAVLPSSGAPEHAFGPAEPDLACWSVRPVVAGRQDTAELLVATRADGARVLLVRGTEPPGVSADPVGLTALLQRLLRVHGDRTPRVEVLPEGVDVPAYHRAALAAATPVWSADPRTARAGSTSSTGGTPIGSTS